MRKTGKCLSMMLVYALLATVFSIHPLAAEDQKITLYPIDDVYVQGSEVVQRGNLAIGCNIGGADPRVAFLKFDLTGYEDVIKIAKSITFGATSTTAKNDADANIKVAVLPENKNDWSSSTLTYTGADSGGYLTAGENVATIESPLPRNSKKESGDFKSAIQAVTGNTVSLRLNTDLEGFINLYGGTNTNPNYKPSLTITVDGAYAEDVTAVQAAYDALDLGDLSNVTTDLALPSAGAEGTYITWETSDAAVVSADGKIFPLIPSTTDTMREPESASATLTATVQKGSVTMEKPFSVTVPSLAILLPTADGYMRPGNANPTGTDGWMYMSDGADTAKRYPVMKFDFSDNMDLIANAEKVELLFAPGKGALSYMSMEVHNVIGTDEKDFENNTMTGSSNTALCNYRADAANTTSFAAGTLQDQKEERVDVTMYAKSQMDGIAAFKFIGGGMPPSGNGTVMYFMTMEGNTRRLVPRLVITPGEEKTVTISPTEDTYLDSGAPNAAKGTETSIAMENTSAGQKTALLKFDLTGLEEQLSTATGVSLRMSQGRASSGVSAGRVYGLPEALSGWDEATTYQTAKAITDGTTDLTSYNANEVGSFLADPAAQQSSCNLDLNYFKSLTGKTVAFKIDANAEGDTFSYKSRESATEAEKPALVITYREKSTKAKLMDAAIKLDIGDLSNVTTNLNLPSAGPEGCTITWTSDNPAVVTDAGVVTPSVVRDSGELAPEVTNVVLTATLQKDGITVTRKFAVSVPVLGYVTAAADTYVRNAGHVNTNYGADTLLTHDPRDTSNRISFIRFDISNQVNYFKNAKKVLLRLHKQHSGGAPNCDLKITAIGNGENLKGSWTEDGLTYNKASALLAYSGADNETWHYTNDTANHFTFTIDITDYMENNNDNLIEFRIEAASGINQLHSKENSLETGPALIAYADDTPSDFVIAANDMLAMFELPKGEVELVTTVDNSSGKYNEGFQVVYAVYSDGVLKSAETQTVASVATEENVVIPSKTITIEDPQKESIQVFIWDSAGNLQPITKKTCFPN